MNILYLFHYYRDGNGGSSAIDFFIEIDKLFYNDYLIVCKKINTRKSINIVSEDNIPVIQDFLSKPDVIIHYVRAEQSNILNKILKLSGKTIPVVTTVVQSPSYKRLLLSPFEICNTNVMVFIDRASYNNRIVSFIPDDHRNSIYLMQSVDNDLFRKTENIYLENRSHPIIFGRGSTLNKCPSDMFLVFDKINIKNKIFRIVGIPEGDNWVRKEAAKRSNVEVYPLLSCDEWFEVCKTFDVFLYQLPKDSYASIDSTLGLALYMRKPVVYMGCEAPKERIDHNESGFIANSVNEMAQFATELGCNYELRKKIGEKGREKQRVMAKENDAEKRFHDVYEQAFVINKIKNVPLAYRLKYYLYCYKDYIRNLLNYYW